MLSAGLPNIEGTINNENGAYPILGNTDVPSTSGAFSITTGYRALYMLPTSSGANGLTKTITFNASILNPIYGNSDTVQPPAVTANYIIKY